MTKLIKLFDPFIDRNEKNLHDIRVSEYCILKR